MTLSEQDAPYHLTRLDFAGDHLWVGRVDQPLGTGVRARVLARDVSLATQAPQGSSINNILNARIEEIGDEEPNKVMVKLRVGEAQPLLARITRRSHDVLGLREDMHK